MLRTRVGRLSARGLFEARSIEVYMAVHCRHVGNDAYYGRPFLLEDWQRNAMLRPVMGAGRVGGGAWRRRYGTALFGLPRNYGKTEFAAALLLSVAGMEPIYNGQYGLVASSIDQVSNIYEKVCTMIRLDADLSAQWDPLKRCIVNRETGAKIIVLPNKESALQSWHFNVIIFDELHVYRDDKCWAAALAGQKGIPNSLCVGITTASDRRAGFLWDLYRKDDDPGLYKFWCGLDDGDDDASARALGKIMLPSWISRADIEAERLKAPSPAHFERYTLNRFPSSKSSRAVFARRQVDACSGDDRDVDTDRWFAVGIDGATSGDTLAVVCCQPQDDGREAFREYTWSSCGDGSYYDVMEVADVLEMLASCRGRPTFGADPARMTFLIKYLARERGVEVPGLKQSPAVMCPASQLLERSVKTGSAALGGCPVLRDHLLNCVEDESKAYGMRFSSEGSGSAKGRIDAAIAAAMAKYLCEEADRPADYTGGVYSFDL